MSLIKNQKGSKLNAKVEKQEVIEPKVSFSIVDTEFLIRLILSSSIDGKDVDNCSSVLKKIKKIHEILVSNREGIL